MVELLPVSIGVGLTVGLLFTEVFGLATGGLIVPGYLGLYATHPIAIALTFGVAFATFAIVHALTSFVIIYGRRRTAMMILVGYLLGILVRSWVDFGDEDFEVIGYIIPGLLALWMDRQGVLETICACVVASVVVRLVLIIAVGTELP